MAVGNKLSPRTLRTHLTMRMKIAELQMKQSRAYIYADLDEATRKQVVEGLRMVIGTVEDLIKYVERRPAGGGARKVTTPNPVA